MPPRARLAFPGQPAVFDDNRTPEQQAYDRTQIEQQIAHLTQFPNNRRRQRRVLRRLAQGRNARGLPPIVKLPIGNKIPALALAEFIVRTTDFRTPAVQAAIKKFGFSYEPVEEFDGALMRLTLRSRGLALWLRGGYPAVAAAVGPLGIQPNYVIPLGGWIKGEGGPENTAAVPTLRPAGASRYQVAVIDTGLGPRTDQWLQGLTDPEIDPLYPDPTQPSAALPRLGVAAGHGTFVAGIVQQVEPSTDIRIYRAVDFDGIGTGSAVGAKIVQAAQDGAKIINLSLGTQTVDDTAPLGIQAGIESVITSAREKNEDILIVCAAGNYGDTRKVWPAAFSMTFPEVVAVAGLDAQGERPNPDWSTHDDPDKPENDPSNFIGVSTIGEGIVSTYVKGIEDPVVDDPPDQFGTDAFAVWAGTSFAAPQVTGAVAKICLANNVEPAVALQMLKDSGEAIPGYGRAVEIWSS